MIEKKTVEFLCLLIRGGIKVLACSWYSARNTRTASIIHLDLHEAEADKGLHH